jgi:hypothetical protein
MLDARNTSSVLDKKENLNPTLGLEHEMGVSDEGQCSQEDPFKIALNNSKLVQKNWGSNMHKKVINYLLYPRAQTASAADTLLNPHTDTQYCIS